MEKDLHNPVVTCVGNSWVVCRSKSHPGRIYYFNTFTGEAVWNLSEVEIEKAKTTTKIIEDSGVNMDGCPEPKDPPQDTISHNFSFNKHIQSTGTSKEFCNNKMINNKTNQANLVSPFTKVQCCNHLNPLTHVSLGIPMSSGLNPNIWNVPIAPQLLLSSSIPSVVNQSQYNMNLHHNNLVDEVRYVQSTSIPLNKRFGKLKNEGDDIALYSTELNLKNDNANSNAEGSNNDLRQLLSKKKYVNFTINTKQPKVLHGNSKLVKDISKNTDTDTCHKEEMACLPNIQETVQKKLNVSYLKKLVKHSDNDEFWYIVADANIFINHHGFLKKLLNSDEECRLLVLDNVIADIRNASRSDNFRLITLARRAICSLSQFMKDGTAIVARGYATEDNNEKSHILDCCLKLMKENYDIVLLCNNKELQNHEKAAGITIFTVNEMKSLINVRQWQHDTVAITKATVPVNQKIIIPNNEVKPDNGNLVGFETALVAENVDFKRKTNTVSVGIQTINNSRTTVDIGIQTQLNIVNYMDTKSTQTSVESSTSEKLNSTSVKRKEIKLTRNLFNQSPKKQDTEKRCYKWRRKRHLSSLENYDTQDKVTSSMDNLSNSWNDTKRLKLVDDAEHRLGSISNSSEIQVSVTNQDKLDDRVVVKDTSGVMVVASRSLESNSECLENTQKLSNINDEREMSKNFMFEVTSDVMAEYVKTRCDEWVSRFIQIMEEVLTQVLQKDPLPYPNSLSPPWTLHEATQCIKMKFLSNCDIVDGANKLSEILLTCSDRKGKIDVHMNPNQYMQMYSYGVYLISSLQELNNDNEDLQTAAESLAKLLRDIENPNAETSQNDSFADLSQETVVGGSTSTTTNTDSPDMHTAMGTCDLQRKQHEIAPDDVFSKIAETSQLEVEGKTVAGSRDSSYVQRNSKNCNSPSRHNLRSHFKISFRSTGQICRPVQLFRCADQKSEFFANLNLRKNTTTCENGGDNVDVNTSCTNENCSSVLNTEEPLKAANNVTTDGSLANANISPVTATQSTEPKIIRQFTKRVDFEEKIKRMEVDATVLDDSNQTDDEYYEYDYLNDAVISEDRTDNAKDNSINDLHKNNKSSQSSTPEKIKIKIVVLRFIREIREAFLVAYAFCDESQKRLNGFRLEATIGLMSKAKEIYATIVNICDALNSIHSRDLTGTGFIIAEFMKEEKVDFAFDEQDLLEYRDFIEKCRFQANLLRDTVKCIMSYAT